MDLDLTFANGQMAGDGNDDIGRFRIKGRYDETARECWWTKTYVGAHDVFYRGFRENKGIWGTWDIGQANHGGFHIWPKGVGEEEKLSDSVRQHEPEDAIASDVPLTVNPEKAVQPRMNTAWWTRQHGSASCQAFGRQADALIPSLLVRAFKGEL